MDISNLSKAKVLAALYNASKPQGRGFLHFEPAPMSEDEAQEIIDSGETYFDYLKGRVMKVDLSGDTVDTWEYNRDNGSNAAETAIQAITEGTLNCAEQKTRQEHLAQCKQRALAYIDSGDLDNALMSMVSDLKKHPETADQNISAVSKLLR